MYTPVLEKAENASKQNFQGVRICPVPICSDELVKKTKPKTKPQNNNHPTDVLQDLFCTTFDFTLHTLYCACAFQGHETEQGLLKKITHLEQN